MRSGAVDALAAKVNPVTALQAASCVTVFEKDWPMVAAIERRHAMAMAPLRPNLYSCKGSDTRNALLMIVSIGAR